MKKRCTNSSCRRIFSYQAAYGLTVCPYCGKEYPRIKSSEYVLINGYRFHFDKIWTKEILEYILKNHIKKDVVKHIYNHIQQMVIKEKETRLGIAKILTDYVYEYKVIPTNVTIERDCHQYKMSIHSSVAMKDIPKFKEYFALLSKHIDELDLSVRSYNCLRRANIETIGQLIELTTNDVSQIRHITKKSLENIEECLANLGLSLKKF